MPFHTPSIGEAARPKTGAAAFQRATPSPMARATSAFFTATLYSAPWGFTYSILPQPCDDLLQPADLLVDGIGDLRRRHRHFQPAEVGAVGIARVRANPHPARQREPRGPLHGALIARMAAAGDVGRGNVLHQRGFVRRVLELAHVAVEIDHA